MISFSGIDCSGKSTQIEKVRSELLAHGCKVRIVHSRGGYTPLLEWMKTRIRPDKQQASSKQSDYRDKVHKNPTKRRMLLWLSIVDMGLYYGVAFRIFEGLGWMILADRYLWDSYIDFVLKYPECDFAQWSVWKLASWAALKPRCSIVYTIPAELSMYRSTLKEEPWPETIEMREKRIAAYLHQIAQHRWQHVIDATDSVAQVFEKTMACISR